MVISSTLMGVSIFLFSSVNSAASNISFNVMEYFFQSIFNSVLYGWTPEAFPAPIRGTACGIASFWGRLFGIVSPLIAQHYMLEVVVGISIRCCTWLEELHLGVSLPRHSCLVNWWVGRVCRV